MTNIDRIYELLSWNNNEEMQQEGIKEAEKVRSLWVFILPILASNSKSIWENCARILASRSDEELKPYLSNLLTWLQDMNWPGANIIFERLSSMPCFELEEAISISLSLAGTNNDFPWRCALMNLKNTICQK